jgi:bacterioferritin-associated ferredoxin
MIVCICRRVSDRTIRAAIEAGASTVEEVGQATRAGTGCGACHESINEMLCERTGQPCDRPSGMRCSREVSTVLSPYLRIAGEAA